MNSSEYEHHHPVMIEECLNYFSGSKLPIFFEGTVGAGGHAAALLAAHPEIEQYIACDRDPEALAIARKTLEKWKSKVTFVEGNFDDLDTYLDALKVETVNGFFLISEFRLCN